MRRAATLLAVGDNPPAAAREFTITNVTKCLTSLAARAVLVNFASVLTIQVFYMSQKKSIFLHNILPLFILLLVGAASAQAQELVARKHGSVAEQLEQSALNNKSQHQLVQDVLDYANRFRGVPYRHGAMSPRAFDCSGFTSYVFKRFGISLDRTSHGQINDGQRVARADLKPGDLVFFNGRAVNRRIGHVGIVTRVNDDNTFNFIHAARTGVIESKSNESYYSRRYMGACRVLE